LIINDICTNPFPSPRSRASPSYILSAPTTTITIVDTDGTSYDDYMAGHGLTAAAALPAADPNGDGISNLVAYVFRLNPAGPFPEAWHSRLPRFTTRGPGPFLPAITWQLPQPFSLDVHFSVQESVNPTFATQSVIKLF